MSRGETLPRPIEPLLTSTLASNAAEALFMIDAEGRVTFMNPAAERMFGWTRAESLGRVLHDLIHYKHADGTQFPMSTCPLGSVMTTGATLVNHEDLFFHKDGSAVPVYCSNAPVVSDGRVTGGVLVVHDLTERKRLEDDLRRRADELSTEAARKDEFLAMLAHELRNPLAAVMNAVHILRQRDGDAAAQQRALEIVERQVGHQIRLVDDLLDIARITRGKLAVRREPVDLARLVEATVADHRRALEKAGLAVEVAMPEQPTWVSGDATRLSQVVGNLLSNAVKFTAAGGQVTIRASQDEARRVAEVRVRDTGVGISPAILPHIFEPFTQADSSLERTLGGLGLGLSLVKGLVGLHDGEVRAESHVGVGSEFIITLPLDAGGPLSPPAAVEPKAPLISPRRVLVIEDNEDVADTMREMLTMDGYVVEVAATGPAGVETARRFRPEIVLCDIGLPGMDGYAVARALRADPAMSARLIALTGYGREDDQARARAAGFDLHVTKPVDPKTLAALLR